jgi:hypothetical protein
MHQNNVLTGKELAKQQALERKNNFILNENIGNKIITHHNQINKNNHVGK